MECRDKPDLTDPKIRDYYLPYEGPNIYPYGVVKLLVDEDVLKPRDCCWGVTATRSISPVALKKAVDNLLSCVEQASWEKLSYLLNYNNMPDNVKQEDWQKTVVNRQKKNAVLQLLNIWNKNIRRQHTIHRTKFEEDMNSEQISSIIYDDHEIPQMLHTTQILDNTTYAPIGRIALYADTINLRVLSNYFRSLCLYTN